MPELPEVETICRRLAERGGSREIDRVDVASLSALKTYDPPVSALRGRSIGGVERRGKFICIDTGGIWLAFHLARSGWLRWREKIPAGPVKPSRAPLALRVRMADGDGFDVTEMATEKRLAIYLTPSLSSIEPIATLGPDPLSPEFTAEALGTILASEKGDLKHALSRQSVIAGIGNAYSDEALHAAKLSPFKPAAKLSGAEIERLHDAVVGVLAEALERAASLDMNELKDGKRTGMRVHGRTGEPCPVCGDTVREVSFATRSLQYCATCQTGGKPLADRRLSRLLK